VTTTQGRLPNSILGIVASDRRLWQSRWRTGGVPGRSTLCIGADVVLSARGMRYALLTMLDMYVPCLLANSFISSSSFSKLAGALAPTSVLP